MIDNQQKIRPLLQGLKVGEEISFPIIRLKSVRTQASELGAIYNKQFTTKVNRNKQTIDVRRLS